MDGRAGVRWNDNCPVEAILPDLPGRTEFAVERFEGGAGFGQAAAFRLHAEDAVLVSGLRGIDVDARDGVVHPRADRSIGVMIERVHTGVLKAAIFRPAVPALPAGG